MSLTLADAITEVRAALNEVTVAYWSDEELTFWIQEGTRVFSSKTLMVEDTQDIDPLIAAQLRYTGGDETWIDDILEPYSAIYYDGVGKYKGLIKITPQMIGNLATFTTGTPKYYCMHDRSIYLFPLASAAVISAGGKVTMLFSCITDDITDLTDEYQHLPIIYATAKAKQKDQSFGEAAALLSQFFQETNFERGDKHTRETDSLEEFKVRKGR
jgi:hypothetical protein